MRTVLLPTLQSSLTATEISPQFKAGASASLCQMAEIVGQQITAQKIFPMLIDLLKEENSEIKLSVVKGMYQIAKVIGPDILNQMSTTQQLQQLLEDMTADGQWRVKMAVFELVADLGILFGK